MKNFIRILMSVALFGLFFAAPGLRGQDKKVDAEALQKKKTQELIEKAEDEYRSFFKKPETPLEFWAAIKFEMDLGKFDLAGLHLKLLLEKEPADEVDKELIKIEQAEGMATFFRLERVRQWSDYKPFHEATVKNVDTLIERTTAAVNKYLGDPVRINKFIKQLDAKTPEERSFAYVQLARSGERAMPYLIEALRVNYNKPLFPLVRETMLRMGRERKETVATWLEVLKAAKKEDYNDLELRLTLLDIVHQLDDRRALPYLWHLSSAKAYPEGVRRKARELQASLMRIDKLNIPPAKEKLTQMAEQYLAQLRAIPLDTKPKKIRTWEWTGEKIFQKETNSLALEQNLGMRYAREALDLDPAYAPAQIVLLNLMLEQTYRPKIEQVLLEPMPAKLQQLLTTLDADLAMRVLERGYEERQLPVILPLIQVLGDRGEVRAAKLATGGPPRGIVRGLYYPDRRVQFAALRAMLQMPVSSPPAVAADRVVDLSRRFLAADPVPKALIVYPPVGQEKPARDAIKDIGYDSETARDSQEALAKAKATADFDLVVLHRGMRDADFAFAYTQLRKDFDIAGLPMIVVVSKEREKSVRKYVGQDPSVIVITEDKFLPGDDFKKAADELFSRAQIVNLTADERIEFGKYAMYSLWRMARGELTGYDVMPAVDAVKRALKSSEHALPALEVLGRLPGKEIQYHLAGIAGDSDVDAKMRVPAVMELNRHMQKNGVQLDKKQIANLQAAAKEAAAGSMLRTQLNVTVSMISRTNAAQTGDDLFRFRPDGPPPPPKKDKEEKKGD